jgi:uncharacterized protein with von Willebrand factor type A (vWA) domain
VSLFTSAEGHAVRRDSYDDNVYGAARDAVPDLAKVEQDFAKANKHGAALVQDLHASLFKAKPILRDERELTPSVLKHRGVLEQLYATNEYQSWHGQTRYDETRSALGAVELAKALTGQLPADEDERRMILRSAIRKAEEGVEDQIETFESLGGSLGDGGLTNLEHVVKAGSVLANNAYVRQIVEQAGRLVRIAKTKHRARVRHGPDEIQDLELGNDLHRIVPAELVLLGDPDLEIDFLRRYACDELLQYRISGSEPLGRGPIVVVLDTSGSMEQGGKEFWAKGLALGIMTIAVEEDRPFVLVNFSSKGQFVRTDFKGRPNLDELVTALEFSYSGDTDFMGPLDAALKALEESKFKNGDLIMLTDGEASMTSDWQRAFKARKEAKAARLFTVLIGTASRSLKPISDSVERIDALADDEAVTDLVFGGI